MEMFVRVVETGSFSKAAREFNTTQPTVTKQVAATEARLKVRLLNRNTRGVSLTESGALYYEKCKAIVRDAEEADSIVQLRQSQAQGLLRIGTSVAFGRRVVVPLALEFMAPPSAGAGRPELRGPLRRPGGAGHRRRDAHGQAGRFVAGRALPGHESLGAWWRRRATCKKHGTPKRAAGPERATSR